MAQILTRKPALLLIGSLALSGCSSSGNDPYDLLDSDNNYREPAAYSLKDPITASAPQADRKNERRRAAPQGVQTTSVPAEQDNSRIYDANSQRSGRVKNLLRGSRSIDYIRPSDENEDGEQTYNLDLTNIDVRDLVSLILGDLLKKNYLLDENIQGKVSLYTPSALKTSDLMPILTAALNSQNAELFETNGLIRIVSESADSGRGLNNQTTKDIMPIFLQNTSARDMRQTLLPVAKDLVEITADEANNILILSGNPKHMTGLNDLVQTLDIRSLSGKSFGLYPLASAEADDIIEELKSVFTDKAPIKFVPVERLNAVLVVAQTTKDLQQAENWIQTLDSAEGKNSRHIYAYTALSGQPDKLVGTLLSLLNGQDAPSEEGAGEDSGSLFDTASFNPQEPQQGSLSSVFARSSDTPEEASVSPGGEAASETGTDQPASTPDGLRIIADKNSNQIFVHGTEDEWNKVQAILRKLDKEPQQVMIEATIVEVSLNDTLRYGLQFIFESGNSSFNLPSFPGTSAGTSGFNYIFDNGRSAQAILDALSSVTDVNVISSPRLMVLGEETATLQIGDQVPIALQSAVPINSNDNRVVNSIEFRDTGVILRVTPHIGAGGTILIDIDQEVSDVAPTTTSSIDSPTIRQRRVSSKVSVQDGETVAFAGLTRNTITDSKSGIPVAREIPVLGALFGSTEEVTSQSELLVLLTPRLVKNLDDARALTKELKGKINSLLLPTEEEDPNLFEGFKSSRTDNQ